MTHLENQLVFAFCSVSTLIISLMFIK